MDYDVLDSWRQQDYLAQDPAEIGNAIARLMRMARLPDDAVIPAYWAQTLQDFSGIAPDPWCMFAIGDCDDPIEVLVKETVPVAAWYVSSRGGMWQAEAVIMRSYAVLEMLMADNCFTEESSLLAEWRRGVGLAIPVTTFFAARMAMRKDVVSEMLRATGDRKRFWDLPEMPDLKDQILKGAEEYEKAEERVRKAKQAPREMP